MRTAFAAFNLLIFASIFVLLPILIGVYVYRDASRRGMNAVLWTLIAILAPSLIGFIIYLLVRGNYSNLKCPRCEATVSEQFVVCPKCGATYHTKFNPSTAGENCDKCGEALSIRKDDAPEVVKSRLAVYHEETEPLKEYYGKKGLVKTVIGQEKLEDTTKLTLEALGI